MCSCVSELGTKLGRWLQWAPCCSLGILLACATVSLYKPAQGSHASCDISWDETTGILACGISGLLISTLWPSAENKTRLVSRLLQTSSCPCCCGWSQSGMGLLHPHSSGVSWICAEWVLEWGDLSPLAVAGSPLICWPSAVTAPIHEPCRTSHMHDLEHLLWGCNTWAFLQMFFFCTLTLLKAQKVRKYSQNPSYIKQECSEEEKGQKKLLEEGGLWQLREQSQDCFIISGEGWLFVGLDTQWMCVWVR